MNENFDLRAQPKPIIEALMVHQALGRLGFPSEVMFFAPGRTGPSDDDPLGAFVVLRWQGRQFVVACGVMEGCSEEDIVLAWRGILDHQRTIPNEVLAELYEHSYARTHSASLVLHLHDKGIVPPTSPLKQQTPS